MESGTLRARDLAYAPFALQNACQDQIHTQCASLENLVVRIAKEGADARTRLELAGLSRSFLTELELHCLDQEADLVPALLEALAGSDAVCIRQMAEKPRAEHRALESLWRRVRVALEEVIEGVDVELPLMEVAALGSLCERHVAFEKTELLPMAERLLSDQDMVRLAQTMGERRGLRRTCWQEV
ncbi:MAG: hemerythrin domain-containing protein [Burkholderiales bacterium]